jgi:hypothetical protein
LERMIAGSLQHSPGSVAVNSGSGQFIVAVNPGWKMS